MDENTRTQEPADESTKGLSAQQPNTTPDSLDAPDADALPAEPGSTAAHKQQTLETLSIGDTNFVRHPLSALFGDPIDEDYATLLESVRSIGQKRPILRADDGSILDGWTRLRVCKDIGLEPVFETAEKGVDLVSQVVALNLAHRHLSAGQRALIAAGLATYQRGGRREGAGRVSIRELAADTVQSDSIRADVRDAGDAVVGKKNQRVNLSFDSFEQNQNKNTPNLSSDDESVLRADAAAVCNVSTAYVSRARSLEKNADPALVAAVCSGKISLNEAHGASKTQPIENQTQWLARRIKEDSAASMQTQNPNRAIAAKLIVKSLEKNSRLPDSADAGLAEEMLSLMLLKLTTTLNLVTLIVERGALRPNDIAVAPYMDAHARFVEATKTATVRERHKGAFTA